MITHINSVVADDTIIKVSGIETERGGNIIVMIFGEEGFPKKHHKALVTQTKSANQQLIEFTFAINLKEMAVKVLHDEDKDGKVTKNWTGIYPKEGLGFSNGQQVSLTGAPKYKYSKISEAQFKNGLTISVKYP